MKDTDGLAVLRNFQMIALSYRRDAGAEAALEAKEQRQEGRDT